MNWEDRIVADVAVLTGKPVVRGTRLAVVFIIDLLAQGWSEADILANYPRLSTDDIRAVFSMPVMYCTEHVAASDAAAMGNGRHAKRDCWRYGDEFWSRCCGDPGGTRRRYR